MQTPLNQIASMNKIQTNLCGECRLLAFSAHLPLKWHTIQTGEISDFMRTPGPFPTPDQDTAPQF